MGQVGGFRHLHWLPSPFPDETLHSLFSRYHKLSDNGCYRNSLEELTGHATCNPFHDIPSFLKCFSDRSRNSEGFALGQLIHGHTAFPYVRRFLVAHQIELCNERFRGGSQRRGGGQGLGFAHVRGQFLPRFCSQCVVADLSTHGQPYWHRIHQLPGVWVCPWHKVALMYVDSSWMAKDKRRLFLPDDPCVDKVARTIDIGSYKDKLEAISDVSANLLFNQAELFDLNKAHLVTRGACEAQGFIFNGRICSERLAVCICDYLRSMPFVGEFYYLQPETAGALPTWVLEVLRAQYRYRPPLEYLILWEALAIKLTETGLAFDCIHESNSNLKVTAFRHKRKYTRQDIRESEYLRRRNQFLTDSVPYPSRRRSYKWLLKHDREWLTQHCEPKRSGRKRGQLVEKWLKRDVELSNSILETAELISDLDGRPVRVTIASIFRELGLPRRLLRYSDQLPRSFEALQLVSESRIAFLQRKVSFAYGSSMELYGKCDPVSVFRFAHMRKPDNWIDIFECARSAYSKREN